MTLDNLNKLLKTTGYPVAYNVFKTPKKPPFICYLVVGSNNFFADGRVYLSVNRVQVELYTSKKDIYAESKVEQALSSMYWQKSEEYIEDQGAYEVIYEIEV